jgi:hypothetical protein
VGKRSKEKFASNAQVFEKAVQKVDKNARILSKNSTELKRKTVFERKQYNDKITE